MAKAHYQSGCDERNEGHVGIDRAPLARLQRIALSLSVLVAVLATLTGCALNAPHMRPAASGAISPDPAAATVVFVRKSILGGAITSVIATAQGRFLGESQAKSYFAAKLPPGEHLLVSWSESTPALRATLAAGMIYYVEVAPQMGFGSARIQLLALGPRRPNWAELPAWLRECDALEADAAGGAALLQERADKFAERVRAAEKSYQGYSAEDREARTLRLEDGVSTHLGSSGGVSAIPAGAPPAPVAPSSAPRADVVDMVVLKTGVKLRGVVMEDEPTRVAIKLVDGSTRVLRRSEIERVEYGK